MHCTCSHTTVTIYMHYMYITFNTHSNIVCSLCVVALVCILHSLIGICYRGIKDNTKITSVVRAGIVELEIIPV